MASARATNYAPDIYKALNGILHVYKPPQIGLREFIVELRERVSDLLNKCEPRPIAKRLAIVGDAGVEKQIVEVPNLADHPLVVGPRYAPWELKMWPVPTHLGYMSSGICVILMGRGIRYWRTKFSRAKLVNVYEISGTFGYVTDTFLYNGKITDKSTYGHIRTGKLDSVIAKIESSQTDRLFDAASVPLNSQEAYELAKAWPSRPARMASWPVIYRIRCTHFKLPEFKIEVTCANENEKFLAQLPHDIGQMLRSAAYTKSIRRVKLGPFDVNDCLSDKDWELQPIIDNLQIYNNKYHELDDILRSYTQVIRPVRTEHRPSFIANEPTNVQVSGIRS